MSDTTTTDLSMTDLTVNDIQGLVIATTELVRNVGKKFIRTNSQEAK